MKIKPIKNAMTISELNNSYGGTNYVFVNAYDGVLSYSNENGLIIKVFDTEISFSDDMILEVLLTAHLFEFYINGVLTYNHETVSDTAGAIDEDNIDQR